MTKGSDSREIKLVIVNEKYGEFNGTEVTFEGFTKIPFSFFKNGFTAGKQILEQLKLKFNKFTLTIVKDGPSEFRKAGDSTVVILNFDDYMDIRHRCFVLRKKTDKKSILEQLPKIFPGSFKPARIGKDEIELPDDIAKLDFSRNELKRFRHLAPKLVEYGIYREGDLKKLIDARPVLHYMHLENIIKDFSRKLVNELPESDWQTFFKQNLIVLNPGYVFCIEKQNIDLEVKLPDFILVDVSGYIDIYEIKTPLTDLLRYDGSHKNYYWSADMGKAISQVENYIDAVSSKKDALRNIIKDKYKFDPRIVRPRGFVIAGRSSQYENSSKKKDDFRLLNESLRNTEILPYDQFLHKFRSFSETIKAAYQKTIT